MMSIPLVLRRSLSVLRQQKGCPMLIRTILSRNQCSSSGHKLQDSSLNFQFVQFHNSNLSLSFSKRRFYWFLASRTFSSQPSTKPQTNIGISTGNLAELALKSKIEKESKDDQSGKENGDEEDKKSAENQVRALKFTMIAMGGIFIASGLWIFFSYGAPTEDQQGNIIPDEFSHLPFVQQYAKRSIAEVHNYVQYIVNPSRDKLLPDPVKLPYHQPPYTLLIELMGVLVHPDWTYKTGWRFKKRPGIDYFLNQISGGYFEVVIYTSEPGMTAFPIVDALDKEGLVHYRLFRDSTKYDNGVHLKDLDKINRDLSKVIAVDCNEKSISSQHRSNALILPRWRGNDDDRALFDLVALLKTIGSSELKDVRGVLEYYSDYADPIGEFRRKQAFLAEQEQEALKKTDIKGSPGFNPAGSFLGSLFRRS